MIVGWNSQDTKSSGKFDLVHVDWLYKGEFVTDTYEFSSDKGARRINIQNENVMLEVQKQFIAYERGFVSPEEEIILQQIENSPEFLQVMSPEIELPIKINELLNVEQILGRIFSDPLRRLTTYTGEKRVFDFGRNNLDYWLKWCSD